MTAVVSYVCFKFWCRFLLFIRLYLHLHTYKTYAYLYVFPHIWACVNEVKLPPLKEFIVGFCGRWIAWLAKRRSTTKIGNSFIYAFGTDTHKHIHMHAYILCTYVCSFLFCFVFNLCFHALYFECLMHTYTHTHTHVRIRIHIHLCSTQCFHILTFFNCPLFYYLSTAIVIANVFLRD